MTLKERPHQPPTIIAKGEQHLTTMADASSLRSAGDLVPHAHLGRDAKSAAAAVGSFPSVGTQADVTECLLLSDIIGLLDR